MNTQLLEIENADLCALLRSQVAARGSWPAYVFLRDDLEVELTQSYAEIGQAAESIASCLALHAKPGDRALLAVNNAIDAVRLFWGCIVAGIVPIPAPAPDPRNARAGESRLQEIAANARVKLALAAPDHLAAARAQAPGAPWMSLQELLSAEPPGDGIASLAQDEAGIEAARGLAYLQYTSGSTSQPRGVEITHENVLAQCRALAEAEMLNPDEVRALTWLPWFHDYGLIHGLIQPLYAGGTSILMPTTHFLLRPLKWLEAIGRYRVTHSGAPDFAYAACVQALGRTPGWSGRLDSWQLATCGAEPVRAATLDAFSNAFSPHGFDNAAFAPSYGLAEAVLAVTMRNTRTPVRLLSLEMQALGRHEAREVPADAPGAKTLVSCGPVLPGFDLQIVDPKTIVPCGHGRIGEIWLAGPSVGRGYWDKPEKTSAHFGVALGGNTTPDLTRYLRTGDLGFLHGKELFIAGRLKDLILVHGRNVYPQDLELTAENAHPAIRPGGVIAIAVERNAREAVVLLIECSRRPAPAIVRDLTEAVRQQVSVEHQIDLADVMALRTGTLPRTSSGKPQRGAARRLYQQGMLEPVRLPAAAAPAPAHAPAGPEDGPIATISRLWAEVLGQEAVEPEADFFDLGGDSLLATQLVSRIRAQLGIDLPISAIFEAPTLGGLARLAAAAPASQAEDSTTAAPMAQAGVDRPLSFSQERMWFMHALAPEGGAYNIPLALRLEGVLDLPALRAALARVVQRHEILRTRFLTREQGIAGEVTPELAIDIDEVHLPSGAPDDLEALRRHLAAATGQPFRLDRLPLLRAQLIRTGETSAVLLFVMHHIIGDQWSCAALGQELAAYYNAARRGEDAALPALPLQYADHAAWHRQWFSGARCERELAYWRRQLQGLEPLSLNVDFARPRQPDFMGAAVRLPLAANDVAALTALGTAHGASLSMVLLAALKVLLLRHTGKTDIAIGVPIANRHQLASENLIGTFVNTLVFRTDLAGEPDFPAVLARVRQTALQAFDHQDMPFEVLVRELGGHADPTRNPLFNVMFNMVNVQARECRFDGLEWSRLDFDRRAAQFDLAVIADTLYDQSIVLEYATALFEHATVERMGRHLLRILRAAIDTPGLCVNAYPLPDAEEAALLRRWSLGPRDIDATGLTVGDWVRRGAQARPDHTALIASTSTGTGTGEARLSHRALDEAACRLARVLRERGIGRGDRVGLCLGRSADLVIALLGILKAGAAYVPLDPDYPPQRLAYQVEDAGLALLVTHSAISADFAQGMVQNPVPRLLLDGDAAIIATASSEPLAPDPQYDARPEDPAYLIYTSGSTGQPKGVLVPHRAVANFLASMARAPGLTPDDRLLAVTTPGFDIAVLELLLPLAEGATVVLASEHQVVDGRLLARLIEAEGVTVLQATPSRWQLLLDAGWQGRPDFKALVGGEPLTPNLATQLLERCNAVWNMYGPTETTVWSSCWHVVPEQVQRIALGKPVAHTSIQVLDAHRQPTPIGVPGEIWIGGRGVTLGYHQRPDLTAQRFVAQPDADESEYRLIYRTGDRGRWRSDGTLEHGGRLDDQVKLRGFRIELGEIESRLLEHPRVARAVVLLREDVPGQPRLVAYVVAREGMPEREALREHLRQWLPSHMVPGHFIEVPAIPLLPNGKINRRMLPAPIDPGQQRGRWVAPRSAAEQAIWGVWSEALQLSDFGVHDNFFDLGGHSILAVRVVSRMEAVLQQNCPLGLLFEHPSVAGLAQAMAARGTLAHRDMPLVALQPHGSGPGLFLLAGAEMYRPLAQALDVPDMRVYGVFSQTEIDLLEPAPDNQPRDIDVPQLATEYLAIIRQQQSRGPYYLGGFSIGGVLAYEVARRLQEAGEEVRLLVMLDTMLPGRGLRHLLAGIHRRLRLLRRQGWRHLQHVQRVLRQQSAQREEPGSRRNRAYASAIRRYDVQPGKLPAVFLQAGDDPSTVPAYGWPRLLPGLCVERVPGRHMDILAPPNAAVLAARLRAYLLPATRP